MDEICKLLSDKIYAATQGGYGIFYEDELLDVIPEDERSRETLEAVLKKLVKCGNLDVKYAKGSTFCMAGLKPYEVPSDSPVAVVEHAETRAVTDTKTLIITFMLAFAGGALGSFLCGLIIHAL